MRHTGCPPLIKLLLGGNLLVRAAGFAYPFMAFHIVGHGHAASVAGVVLATFAVTSLVGQLVCGWLVDSCGRRVTLVATMLIAAVVLIRLADAHTVPALLIGAALAGLVYDAPRPVISAAINDLIADPQRRAKVDAFRFSWVTNAGSAIAGGLGGLLADWTGIAVLFWINGIAFAIFAVMALCFMPADARGQRRAAGSTYRQALSDRRLVALMVSSVATLTAFMSLFTVMPMLIADRGLAASTYGWVQMASALAVIAITPVISPWLSRRIAGGPSLGILAASGIWTSICMGAAAIVHTPAGLSLAAAAAAPSATIWFVAASAIVHRIAPPAQRGRYHGIFGAAVAAAAVVAPVLAACSLTLGGCQLTASVIVAAGLVGAAMCVPLSSMLGHAPSTESLVLR